MLKLRCHGNQSVIARLWVEVELHRETAPPHKVVVTTQLGRPR